MARPVIHLWAAHSPTLGSFLPVLVCYRRRQTRSGPGKSFGFAGRPVSVAEALLGCCGTEVAMDSGCGCVLVTLYLQTRVAGSIPLTSQVCDKGVTFTETAMWWVLPGGSPAVW